MKIIYKKVLIISALLIITACEKGNLGINLIEPEQLLSKAVIVDVNIIQNRNDIFFIPNEAEPFTGVANSFWDNGQLSTEQTYENGKIVGLSRSWYKNGQLSYEGTFEVEADDYYSLRHNGGKYSTWYENGQLKEEVNGYKNYPEFGFNIPEGITKEWYENGQLKEETIYENGGRKANTVWEIDGKLDYERYKLEGGGEIYKSYFNGIVEITYNEAGEEIVFKRWYENGQLASEVISENGEEIEWKRWNEDGSDVSD